jgi:FMN reductase [NAD(P)H]
VTGRTFRDLLTRRRMVRSYLPDAIEPEVVDRIVGTVRRAPSAGFSQGHRLVVVTDPATRCGLAELAGEGEYVALGMDPWISVAPVHVVVGVREASYHERYTKADKLVDGEEIAWPAPYWYVDSGSLFLLLQLAALDEGLGAGVYGVPGERVPELKALLGIPGDVHFVCVVTIGKQAANESERVSRLTQQRLPLTELVHHERWGGMSSPGSVPGR